MTRSDLASRLRRIEETRNVALLAAQGLGQEAIAERLHLNAARVQRLQRAAEMLGQDALEVTPEEIILRAAVEHTDRRGLVERLSSFEYSVGEPAPYPLEGYLAGSWDQVRQALLEGLLTEEEYAAVAEAVGMTHD